MIFAVVEESQSQAEVLKALLRSEGHQVEIFAGGNACLDALKTRHFDFYVIDCNLPDIGGDEVLRHIRERCDWRAPIVFCTGHADEKSASDILCLGADDYIQKPIRYLEFMARVHALMRRRQSRQPILQLGSIEVDIEGRHIRMAGTKVELTFREFELALTLLRNVGRVLSRHELLTSVWARASSVDTRTVDTHASRLRKKLGWAGDSGLMLSSVYGQGYRLDTVQSG